MDPCRAGLQDNSYGRCLRGGNVLYLHGFNSSPQSVKATAMSKWLASKRPDINLYVPELPFSPSAAINMVTATYFKCCADAPSAIIGSSLGGYYALYLAAKYQLKAAVVNPAVRPFELLKAFLGSNVNLYNGSSYWLTTDHIGELLALRVRPAEYGNCQILALLQTGDLTLDYREAANFLAGQPMWLFPGGTHEFENFEDIIPSVIGHFGL